MQAAVAWIEKKWLARLTFTWASEELLALFQETPSLSSDVVVRRDQPPIVVAYGCFGQLAFFEQPGGGGGTGMRSPSRTHKDDPSGQQAVPRTCRTPDGSAHPNGTEKSIPFTPSTLGGPNAVSLASKTSARRATCPSSRLRNPGCGSICGSVSWFFPNQTRTARAGEHR